MFLGSTTTGSPYLGAIEGRGLDRDWVIVLRMLSKKVSPEVAESCEESCKLATPEKCLLGFLLFIWKRINQNKIRRDSNKHIEIMIKRIIY